MADTTQRMTRTERKPYQAPRLVQYGSLRELTRQTSCRVNKDGGSNGVCSRT